MPVLQKTQTVETLPLSEKAMLAVYQRALEELETSFDKAFAHAQAHLATLKGTLILAGVGKSGHIAKKLAASFTSTGTPAVFIHPTEAAHGDLGMIGSADTLFVLSNSGETQELAPVLRHAKHIGAFIISMTAVPQSSLGRAADVVLTIPSAQEICPLGLAPTTSTFLMLTLGDILMSSLAHQKNLSAETYKQFHPGGNLGFKLTSLENIMRTGSFLPLVSPQTPMSEVLLVMTEKQSGCVVIAMPDHTLLGIISDGDLRRAMHPSLLTQKAEEIMTREPITAAPTCFLDEAMTLMSAKKIHALCVTDPHQKILGLATWHDCLSYQAQFQGARSL
ncbi:KpsF/GutQ family sugar-phosphate isomerase [Candidatus Hepatobacter penaei]|uniref:KpsF/GutQ family sugar-phosphate isomerase n=1 Tax=Candidatus Hepatobacter penaei TaxID=1274402 RepID=UPI0006970195|nr:KpsF/GutQ family sugar-phosphate isomerase [Candidatus Hepatobacter penaei]